MPATNLFLGLCLLLPLPCANITAARHDLGITRFPASVTGPAGMVTSCSESVLIMYHPFLRTVADIALRALFYAAFAASF
jgi:hypothetical protein